MKWGLWEGHLLSHGAASYGGKDGFDRALATLAAPAEVAAISVAPHQERRFAEFCESRWQLSPVWYSAVREGFGILSQYEPAESLGVDRFAALVGARRRWPHRALCVVDCGTAMTIDGVDAEGVFWGGVILPGVRAAGEALSRVAPSLLVTAWDEDVSVWGLTTQDAVRGGVVKGAAGAIERVFQEQCVRLMGSPLLILTGGDAPRLGPHLRCPYELVPHLTLEGVAVMAV